MQRFATDETVARLRARLDALEGTERAAALVELAWYERQRDSRRALALADEAAALLAEGGRTGLDARLLLVRAESSWLFGEPERAEQQLAQARELFDAVGDVVGRCDALWLEASLVNDRGDYARRGAAIARSGELATSIGDRERADTAHLALLCFEAFADPAAALVAHEGVVSAWLEDPLPAVSALAHGFMHHGLTAVGRYAESIHHGLRAAELALGSGQLRRAVIDITNTATVYLDLNDVDSALAVLQDNLTRVRPTGWPQVSGISLSTASLALMKMNRLEAAATLADEALGVLSPFPNAKTYHIARQHRATIALAQKQWEAARSMCEAILAAPLQGDMIEMRRFASQGLAEAFHGLGDAQQARAQAEQALALAIEGGDITSQMDAHRLLARIALAQAGPSRQGQAAALDSLQSALALAHAQVDFTLPPALFEELATEQARAGQFQAAFETLQRAVAARDAQGLREASQRAIAMEVRFKTERALADAQRQRELAQAESRRAGELAQLNAQLRTTMAELQVTQALLTRRNTELKGAYAAMKDLSLTDPLTGLRNRRFLTQTIDQDIAHAVRQHESRRGAADARRDTRASRRADLIFFLVDLDHFKGVNDRHGHAAGDEVLVQFKDRLLGVFRTSDHIVRWGGEEFLVVARGTQRACAPQLAERLRAGVAEQAFALSNGQSLRLTCSIGYACFPPDPAQPRQGDWMEVVERADQRLYQAKAGGRNRWVGEPLPDAEAAEPA